MRQYSAVLLPSKARTATTTAPSWRNRRHTGIHLTLNVTAASGTGGLTVKIQGVDRGSGNASDLLTDGAAITATGTYTFQLALSEGAAAAGVRAAASRQLPADWQVQVAHGDGSSYTYSLTAQFLR